MTATTTPAVPVHGRPAHRDGNVLRWLAAYTASSLGDGVYFLALGFAAATVASPARAGMVMAAGSIPRAALMLGGGVAADRWGPRRVVIGSDALRCLFILCAAAVLVFASPGLWLLVTVALVFGVVDALFMPAVGALPPRIASADQLVRLQGMRALASRVSEVAGPPLGGLAMGFGGATAAFVLAGSFFAVSVPLLIATRMSPLPQDAPAECGTGGAWRELLDGLRYLSGHRLVGPLVVSGAVCEVGLVGPLNIGMILLAQDRGWGAAGYGWIVSVFGGGAAAGALVLTARGRLPKAGVVQIGTLFTSAVALGLIGCTRSFGVVLVLALLGGLLVGVCGGLVYALVQTATAPGYLGRVMSVMSLSSFGLAPLTYPLCGAAVSAWGPGPVFLAGAAIAAIGGIIGLAAPAVRGAELPCPQRGMTTRQPPSTPAPA